MMVSTLLEEAQLMMTSSTWEGGGAVMVSASSEETDPADELLHLQCVPGQLCDSSALPCAPIPPTHTHASCPPALVPAVRPWAAL